MGQAALPPATEERGNVTISVRFWGVRGSVPTPLTPAQVTAKVRAGIELAAQGLPVPFETESTHGGNTTCVEIRCGEELFILDMGTGVRELGKVQLAEAFREKKLRGTILQSHVHWDHIQGVPFWAPLFLPRRQFDCQFQFFGGKRWDSQLDLVYRGQMSPPEFPVNLEELEQTAMRLSFETIWDGWSQRFSGASVLARKLFHPQETFGYRLEYRGKVVAFTTDHEPHASGIPRGLAELVQGADIWITDCQYSHDEYVGARGPQKMGWGHSYPEYIATVAKETRPGLVITTHHDPDSDDKRILEIARLVQEQSGVEARAAWEGMSETVANDREQA